MTFWHEKVVVARKAYRCEECGKRITAGEPYTSGAGINVYGEFGAWKTHSDCLAATLEQRGLADLQPDEWSPVDEWIWELDGPELAKLAMDYPAVFARMKDELAEHDHVPEHYIWHGFPDYVEPRRRRNPYVWEKLA